MTAPDNLHDTQPGCSERKHPIVQREHLTTYRALWSWSTTRWSIGSVAESCAVQEEQGLGSSITICGRRARTVQQRSRHPESDLVIRRLIEHLDGDESASCMAREPETPA